MSNLDPTLWQRDQTKAAEVAAATMDAKGNHYEAARTWLETARGWAEMALRFPRTEDKLKTLRRAQECARRAAASADLWGHQLMDEETRLERNSKQH